MTERERPSTAPPGATALLAAGAHERYEHLVERTVTERVLYMWGSEDGAVLLEDARGREAVPIWPHPWYAQEYCGAFDRDALPDRDGVLSVDVYDWCARWLGPLVEDGVLVAAFPVLDGPNALVEARQFAADVVRLRDARYGCLKCDAEVEQALGSARIADAVVGLEEAGVDVPE